MSEKALLIDTSLCMGCRGCQVACKQWWQQGTDATTQTGTYQNPPDQTWKNWSVVRFNEGELNGQLAWFFAKDQCRHCADPMPCKLGCPNGCISKNEFGAVIIDEAKCGNCEVQCAQYCPYSIPKQEISPEGVAYCRVFKCRMCPDRLEAGKAPACATTCPPGAIHFGDKADMVTAAEARVAELKSLGYADAQIYPGTTGNAMWVLLAKRDNYLLAEYQEYVPGKGKVPTAQPPEPRPMLAGKSVLSPLGAAAIVGTLALGALKALSDRKEMVASLEEDEQ